MPLSLTTFLIGVILFSQMAMAFQLPKTEVLLKNVRKSVPLPVLSEAERSLTLKQSALVFEQIYAHTDIKIADFLNPALDPYQRMIAIGPMNTMETLTQISRITFDLRDLHQSVQWPRPYSCLRTFVPLEFGVASLVPFDRRVVVKNLNAEMVSSPQIRGNFDNIFKGLPVGSVITKIDGIDIWSAVTQAGVFGAGANDDAFLLDGLFALTFISQRMQEFPGADSLKVSFIPPGNNLPEKTVELPYIVKTSVSCQEINPAANGFGLNVVKKPKPLFLRQHPLADDLREGSQRQRKSIESRIENLKSSLEPTIKYGSFVGPSGRIGYLRIDEFSPEQEIDVAQKQIEKIVASFQKTTTGLVIDVRGNPGGSYGDYLTQFFSAIPVVSQTEELRASPINLNVLKKMSAGGVDPWAKSALLAVQNGVADHRRYSDRVPVNSADYLNERGRIYFHPVILLTDPTCFSYCDYFSTSMQDHHAAEVWIENGAHTGGGGAIVSSYEGFSKSLPADLPPLPQGQDIGIAFSTGYRTGDKENIAIENRGADADRIYHSTFKDIENGDEDLIQALGARFKELSQVPNN